MDGTIRDMIRSSTDKVLAGGAVDPAEALVLASAGNADLIDLFSAANRV
ncbi:MAG: biotin synthase BioB, partial [Nitrospirae bacterium]|nr:biotin synthase BioB [Nitrospirota bacterium]